ncbi:MULTISPECIES: DNA replication terminus site-binding protein [unclassified Pseudoalteromonas]|uniref:DNA replication terminus site-binding protein n=1 Tax=unclassified Pseudoalteromonas TaxID=194690 RepID=UPI0020979354|nr:DNA replication terminus site-binding protein [Pseudoalteromonas sp. XMcav2-N]MCO7187592.1 DNA replication terminus site-binding protein [Pseudoalteromonas sp. XMcav2-N]
MKSKLSIRSHFDYLFEQISLFCEEIQAADVTQAVYFKLPAVEKKDETSAPESIPVEKLTGDVALSHCITSFKDLFLDKKESGKVLTRHPGLLLVNDPKSEIRNRLVEINLAKDAFKELVLEIANNDARFEAVHSAVPGLVTLAAYRKIHFEHTVPYSVRFTWMTKHSTKTLSKKAALDILQRSSQYTNPRAIDQNNWQSIVEQERLRVSSLSSSAKLRIRRPTRVSPEVNVRFSAKNRYHVSGALPFVLLNPQKETKIGELKNYIREDTDPRKKEYNYLIERIYLEKVNEDHT